MMVTFWKEKITVERFQSLASREDKCASQGKVKSRLRVEFRLATWHDVLVR